MADKIELILAINEMANYLNKISRWYDSRQEPFGHIEGETQTSYIYEFYCYMKFVEELSIAGNHIKFNYSGKKGPSFPKGPAEKDGGWAKFEITDLNGNLFDVCAGVKIHTQIDNYTYGADISIQSPAPIPSLNDVFLIVDAKYKTKPTEELPIGQLREFRAVLQDLGFPKNIPASIKLTKTSFDEPTIVTNGQINANHIAYATQNKFKQIGNFHP